MVKGPTRRDHDRHEIRRVECQHSMTVFAVGVNRRAARQLREFTPNVAELAGFEFSRLFHWVSERIIEVSQTTPGEEPEAPDMSQSDWHKR
jgi:uncharacterized protein YegL